MAGMHPDPVTAGIPGLKIDRGRTGQDILQQELATLVVSVDHTIRTTRSLNAQTAARGTLIGNYNDASVLMIEEGDLLFSKNPMAKSAVVGTSTSAFSVFDGLKRTQRIQDNYIFRGIAQNQFSPADATSRQGVNAVVRGSMMYHHTGEDVLPPGAHLLWDVRDSNDPNVMIGQTTTHGPPTKRARLAIEMPVRAHLKPVTKTDILAYSTRAVRDALDTSSDARPFDLPLCALDTESECAEQNRPSNAQDVVLSTVKLPIAAIALATLVTFYQHGIIRFNDQMPTGRPNQAMSMGPAKLAAILEKLDLVGGAQSKTRGEMNDILQKVYWDYNRDQRYAAWNNPAVWCANQPTAQTLLKSYKVLTTGGHMDQFVSYSSSIIAEVGGMMRPGDSHLIVL